MVELISKSPNVDYLKYISSEIDNVEEELYVEVNKPIHDNPELGFDEYKAHETLTDYLEKQAGWTVTKSACGMDTAFIAVFAHNPSSSTRTVSYNAEYDSLPGIGHACGHNLIATSSVAAALATAKAMLKFDVPGIVKLLGTPAEEGGGGKVKFINAGAYDDCDVSLMAHPGANSPGTAWGHTSANYGFDCEFFGKAAHAAADPWDGINALDAQMIYYTCTSVLRQQLMPGDIVQGIIANGGAAPNIISDYTKNSITVRAKSIKRLYEVRTKVVNCVKAASLATGCTYKLTETMEYNDMISNDPMCDVYRDYYNAFSIIDGAPFLAPSKEEHITGDIGASSDQGNVSYTLPSIQPMFAINSPDGSNHNEHFAAAAGTKDAHLRCMKVAKCLALTAVEILASKELMASIKAQWDKDMEENRPDVTMW